MLLDLYHQSLTTSCVFDPIDVEVHILSVGRIKSLWHQEKEKRRDK
jgi:hypothetical protein